MTTDEIIRRLKNILRDPRWPDLCASAEDIYKDDAALRTAIQAVERLEQIKKELRGHCEACTHKEKHTYEPPCDGCINCGPFDDDVPDRWEFRWPLGEEAEHETH